MAVNRRIFTDEFKTEAVRLVTVEGHPARQAEDRALVAKIQAVHSKSRRIYGSPRVHASLKAEDYQIGRNRVARLMRKNDIRAQDQAQVPGHHRRLPRSSGRAQPARPAVHGRGAEHGLAG